MESILTLYIFDISVYPFKTAVLQKLESLASTKHRFVIDEKILVLILLI